MSGLGQQSGIGLGVVGDGKGWSGGATRTDGEASQTQKIKEQRPKVFLEICINNRKLGRVVLELFGDVVPRTVENFRSLCTGERGMSPVNSKPLHLKASKFHKILPGKVIQGGDIVNGSGRGGCSIYNQDGDGTFACENFKLKHDRPGLIGMAHQNNEDGKVGSQFYFTTRANPKLDGKQTVFGRVIDGMDKVLKLESIGSASGKPLFEASVSDCGELESEAMKNRKRKYGDADERLPSGWTKKESRSNPGLVYYSHEDGHTQFERPMSHGKNPLGNLTDLAKRRRYEAEKSASQALPERAVKKGEARVWHILKKHRDFFNKPATSWRQREISWSKKEAQLSLAKIREKLLNVGVGGGQQALQRKFENYARQESDDDLSAKVGGDLGPIAKRSKFFGGTEIATTAFELKVGAISQVIESNAGVHLIARFE